MAKSQSELSTIKGVGPTTRKKLESAKITTLAKLLKEDDKSLAAKISISEKQAAKILQAAKDAKPAPKKKSSSKKKKTAKKSAPKASSKKVDAKQAARAAAQAMQDIISRARDHFKRAPSEHVFVLHSGTTLQDLFDLAQALEDIEEHVFKHHVNDERHDFANWVQHVLDEHSLADELREARKHPEAHERVIYRHITRRVW